MFPEQLRGPATRSHLAGEEGLLRRHRPPAPAGRRPRRTARPASSRPRPTRARSRACGRATTRRTTGRPGTSRASRRARRRAGRRSRWRARAPTRRRAGRCSRATSRRAARASADRLVRPVPAQPERRTARRTRSPAATTRSSTARSSAIRAGCRSGRSSTSSSPTSSTRPGKPFEATVHLRSGQGHARPRHGRADGPGRLDGRRRRSAIGPIREPPRADGDVRRHAARGRRGQHRRQALRAPAHRPPHGLHGDRRARRLAGRGPLRSAGASGRSTTTGSSSTAPRALRVGRSAAAQSMGIGETITIPVDVHNWSDERAERHGVAGAAGELHRRRDLASRTARSRPARTRRSSSQLTSTDTALPATPTCRSRSPRRYSAPAGGQRDLTISLVPTTSDPAGGRGAGRSTAQEGAGEYGGPALDVGKRWEGTRVRPLGVDCGTSGTAGDPRRARTRRSRGTATTCTSSSTSATTSRATRSSRPSASRTGSRTRSRS